MIKSEQFIKEMRELCAKYSVEIHKEKAYYPGDPNELQFCIDDKLLDAEELFGPYYKGYDY